MDTLDSKYQLGSTLGHGSYGKAILAVRLLDGRSVVVKQARKRTHLPDQQAFVTRISSNVGSYAGASGGAFRKRESGRYQRSACHARVRSSEYSQVH